MSTQAMLRAIKHSWEWLALNKDKLTIIFALAAGITTLYQYRESVDDGRKKETLKYVERYQDKRVGEARAAIATVLLDAEKFKRYQTAASAASAKQPDTALLEKFVMENNLQIHLITVTEHFMNLAACVESGICHQKLACDFFQQDITALNNSFRQLFEITWKSHTGENYMSGPIAFVKACDAAARAKWWQFAETKKGP